jgi:class 3 adenylate cyclase
VTAVLGAAAVVCFGIAAVRYWLLYRRRPAVMLLGVITAFALLAEASVTIAVARNWQLSWWTWHLLMAAGFGFVAYSAWVQYQREGRAGGLFDSVAAGHAVARIREEYGAALESLVGAMSRREQGVTDDDLSLITTGLAHRFGLTDGQTAVLGRAATALTAEREQIRRLGALVGVGQECSVIVSEEALLLGAVRQIAAGFGQDTVRIGLIRDGRVEFPGELCNRGPAADAELPDAIAVAAVTATGVPVAAGGLLVLPLTVKGKVAGVLAARRSAGTVAERDSSLLRSLASQLSIGLENARLYQQIDVLFRQYMSPDVATTLLADPSQAALGGAVVEVTALFADLRGFTTFSERSTPEEIVAMLNRYFEAATACILGQGGTVVQFVGDALMALFNAPARQPDHALRAARAALEMQRAVDPIAAGRPDWPRFRVGVNTGPALVGNIGSEALRNFNAMGDAVNVAARLESIAEPGTVVIGAATRAAIGAAADVEPLGELTVKGRSQHVDAYVLRALHPAPTPAPAKA